jgi:Bacterial Ig-like domain (group 2)
MTKWQSAGKARPLLVFLALLLGGCGDGTSPDSVGSSVLIRLGLAQYDEQTIAIGETLQLSAEVLNESGDPLSGQSVQWSSDQTDVARVTDDGLVTAVGLGTARIIARHPVGEDTALVNVAQGLLAVDLPECGPGEGMAIAAGGTVVLDGHEALRVCLSGGEGGDAEYALAAVNLGSTSASVLQVRIDGVGAFGTGASTNRVAAASFGAPSLRPDEGFHQRLRGTVSQRLEGRMQALEPEAFTAPNFAVSVNQVVSFNVNSASGDGCANPDRRGGRVRYVGDHAVAVADTLNPLGGFTDEDYRSFIDFFDDEVWPLVTSNFGEPSDIDQSQKVVVFFTRAVNELVENRPARNSYVGGFFFNRDLFPTSSCAGSNASEMFYMLVPDPTGATGGRAFGREFVTRSTKNVLVHEFQHLVNDSRRLHVNNAPEWEDAWLNEGLSHIAEELMFYRQSGLAPGQNIGPVLLAQSQAAKDAFYVFQLDNFERFKSFLREPEDNSVIGGANVLGTRGATWSFLRYVADREPGDDTPLWHALVRDTRSSGLANLRAALAVEPADRIRDWAAALYADDLPPGSGSPYQLASWNFRAISPNAGNLNLGAPNQTYPLFPYPIGPSEPPITVGLQGGGAVYAEAFVEAGEVATVRYVLGSAAPFLPLPSRVQVVVMRVR